MILDFCGFEMTNPTTGELRRKAAQPPPRHHHHGGGGGGDDAAGGDGVAAAAATWQARFENLNTPRNHNFMRISRILSCLQSVPTLRHWARPLLNALYDEAFAREEVIHQ